MELTDVLQAILDKAGDKDYYVSARIETEGGEVKSISVSLELIEKPKKNSEGKDVMSSYPGPERAGKVDITEIDRTTKSEKPGKDRMSEVKEKINILKR